MGKATINTFDLPGISPNATVLDVANSIRATASADYQARIPVLTQENIAEYGNAMMNYQPAQNEFLHNLVNRIGLVVIQNKLWMNPLAPFKRGMLNFGDSIEEIFVNIAKAQQYTVAPPQNNPGDVFEVHTPDVKAIFHRRNMQVVYTQTINNDMLRTAFLSYRGIEDLIARIVDSMYTSDNYDEFLIMKELMNQYYSKGLFYPVQVTAPTDEASAKTIAKTVRAWATSLTFLSNKYNAQGVYTHSPLEDQILIMTPATEAILSVEVLAYAFNMDKADFLNRVVIVDDLGGLEKEGVLMLMVDRDWFMCFDTFYTFTEQYNALHLYWNYFFHHQGIFSTSQFANAIAFTTATPAITSVTVDPATATVAKGKTQQFSASVVATGGASERVEWSITGSADAGTAIDNNGLLVINENETAATITVTATSAYDSTTTGTATVTVASA